MTDSLEILLVEDNEGDVVLTQRAFHDLKPTCHLSVVNDGVEAIEFLLKQDEFPSAFTPQLILLDLNMPRMDGKTFLETIKGHPQLKVIPVVMFTSSKSPVDIRQCYERYVSCYIVKPFDIHEFANAVKQVVNFWNKLGQLPY